MNIDMTKYKVIYKDSLYCCISMSMRTTGGFNDEPMVVERLMVTYLDFNNCISVFEDAASEFQFVVIN